MGVFSALYGQMDAMIVSEVLGGYDSVVDYVRVPLATGIGIYIALAGYAVMRGIAGDGLGHLITQGVKAGLVFAAVTTGLGGVTARSVMNLPSELASLADKASPGQQIDTFVGKIDAKSTAIVHAAPHWKIVGYEFDDPTLTLVSWLPKLAAIVLGALMLVYVVFLKFALAVTALFGPIFVAMLLFDSTRGMFFTWFGAALGYALSSIIIGTTISFIFTVCNTGADSIITAIRDGGIGETGAAAATDGASLGLLLMTAVILVGFLFLLQAQGIAQGMAGGGGGSGSMVAGAAIASTVQLTKQAVSRMAPTKAGGFSNPPQHAGAGGAGSGFAFRAGQSVGRAARASQQSMRRIMGK